MKTLVLFLFPILLLTGCIDNQENKAKIAHFLKSGKLLCGHSYYTSGLRYTSLQIRDYIVADKNSYMIINHNSELVINDLSIKKYQLEFCSVINESDTFKMDDGEYILLNGVVKKLKS